MFPMGTSLQFTIKRMCSNWKGSQRLQKSSTLMSLLWLRCPSRILWRRRERQFYSILKQMTANKHPLHTNHSNWIIKLYSLRDCPVKLTGLTWPNNWANIQEISIQNLPYFNKSTSTRKTWMSHLAMTVQHRYKILCWHQTVKDVQKEKCNTKVRMIQ